MKKNFLLTKKNQKGQVAIFVALIFQVVFVFFAVLINVGLLVHHKINLQQSADLSAYYGAMKQAEIMNMMSHVNFQMRQAWKLLTWRYRVVGTFGFQDWPNGRTAAEKLEFPLDIPLAGGMPTTFNPNSGLMKCAGVNANIIDIPFFCIGHAGFSSWTDSAENNCRINCKHLQGLSSSIAAIQNIPPYVTGDTAGVIGSVNQALTQANTSISKICNNLGPVSFNLLAKFIISYGAEVNQKKKLIQMLGANLSQAPEKAVDLEGGLIKDGALKTFDKNLTEANLKGKLSFESMNGLAGTPCAFQGSVNDGKVGQNQFLSEIKFQVLQYFIHQCTGATADSKVFKPEPIFKDNNFNSITEAFIASLSAADKTAVTNQILNTEYVLGYEKNPWCQVYYGVKAQSEPTIPFLPLAKIKLSAVAFAKPFGGSMGPRYNNIWTQGQGSSDSGGLVDATLPPKTLVPDTSLPPLKQHEKLLPNYANFPGDDKGLKDPVILATYQDVLLHRQLSISVTAGSQNISVGKETAQTVANVGITHPDPGSKQWPHDQNWFALGDPTAGAYDYLSMHPDQKNSFIRDLEISVLAPNFFDLTYYSIDPDYYNNYHLKITGGAAGNITYPGSFAKIKAAANGFGPDLNEIKPDYGNNTSLSSSIASGYSVRHQIAVAEQVLKPAQHKAANFPDVLVGSSTKFIPGNPSSLLTGWTYKNFGDYDEFPNVGPDAQNTMTFGKCKDADWNNTGDADLAKLYGSPATQNLPPTPGNCIWGGRTGYSVKLISPNMVRVSTAPTEPHGGVGTNGKIVNLVDDGFFNF